MSNSEPIRARVSTVGDVLDGLELDVEEMQTLDALHVDLSVPESGPAFTTVAALAWLQARRSTHPGISWDEAEPLILIALS